jgi:hypothetical protein
MRPVAVVMVGEDAKYSLEVAAVEDEQPVETLGTGGANEPLCHGIRSWRPHRRLDDLDAFASEDGVEVTGELAVTVADQEPNRRRSRTLRQRPGGACWVTQAPLGFCVQPARCTRRLPSSVTNSTYSRCSETVSTVKKSMASMLCACARRNARQQSPLRSPTGPRPCRVRKSIGHAARAYSWISPPSRSRRWIRSGGFEPTRRRLGPGVGGVSPRARCGLWVLWWST